MQNPKESARFSILTQQETPIIFLESAKNIFVEQRETLNFSGKTCVVSVSDTKVSFETANKKVTFNHSGNWKTFHVLKIKDFACVQAPNEMFVYSIKKDKLTHIVGDELSLEKDVLTITKKEHDSQSREKTLKIKFDENLTIENQSFVFTEDKSKEEDLTAYKFLESVKVKDFSYALKFLSDELKTKIDENQLGKFFGNISQFLPLSTDEFIVITNGEKSYVKFSINHGKVDDISIDVL
ncbi:MAG: hypothetical protein K2K31_02885 [Clostridia bacterium]|nr:hypothetical protein [Clostridia bacterium]